MGLWRFHKPHSFRRIAILFQNRCECAHCRQYSVGAGIHGVLNPDYAVVFLFLSKTPSNTRTCSFRVLTVEVTTAARPKLARVSRDTLEVLVFFGVLNIIKEIDCIILSGLNILLPETESPLVPTCSFSFYLILSWLKDKS